MTLVVPLRVRPGQREPASPASALRKNCATCQGSEIELLKTLECGMMVFSGYPARRHVSFELDRISYEAAVVLKGDDKLQLISPPD